MNARPRLLFLAHPFPPLNAPACVRTWNTAKYLARLGWLVRVVTPDPWLLRRMRTPPEFTEAVRREGIELVLTGHSWKLLCTSPRGIVSKVVGGIGRRIIDRLQIDTRVGWPQAVMTACRDLTPDDVDVILATGSPFISFSIAERLSRRLGRPFVLDYRDPWTGSPHVDRPWLPRVIEKERSLLKRCDAAIIVSASWARSIQRQFDLDYLPHVISNGYDPEELDPVPPHNFGHFAIIYTGGFYPPKRAITPVMAALRQVATLRPVGTAGGDWRFHYYGRDNDHVRASAEKFGLLDRVVLHGPVPRAEALAALRGAAISVVITTVLDDATVEDKGIVTGKIFDALGYGVPVLLVAPRGSDAESIVTSSGCARRFLGSETHPMASYIVELMAGTAPKPAPPRDYAWPAIAGSLDAILRDAIETSVMRKEVR